MAALRWCICLILTLWMAGSRPPAAVLPRSPDSSLWWGQESKSLNVAALKLRRAGKLDSAEALYRQGYREALGRGDPLAAVRFLISAGGCQLLAFHYRDALATFLEARSLARRIGDYDDLGAIAVNLSTVYLQSWDVAAAMQVAEEGLAEAIRPPSRFFQFTSLNSSIPSFEQFQSGTFHFGKSDWFLSGFRRSPALDIPYYIPSLLLELGHLHSLLGDGASQNWFNRAIEAARLEGNLALEAQAWDRLGDEWLIDNRLGDAERAFGTAFRLRLSNHSHEIGLSNARLGALKLAQGDFSAAARFTDEAIRARQKGEIAFPDHILLNQRGRIHLAQGEERAALADLSAALDSAARWRIEVPPARSSLTGANIGLEKQVFDAFSKAAAEYAICTRSALWAQRAFEAVELNRASSLRESVSLAEAWHERLPQEYWEISGRLAAKQARAFGNSATNIAAEVSSSGGDTDTEHLRLQLTEMEAKAGLGFRVNKNENFQTRRSLIHFQWGLRESELFLSFSLGNQQSYLWSVSRDSVHLHRLPAAQYIAGAVQAYRKELLTGGPAAIRLGQALYKQLFGTLAAPELAKKNWLLSLEGPLFSVPFSALVSDQQNGKPVYLIETHSLQIVPGALLLRRFEEAHAPADAAKRADQSRPVEFLAVGDPIYNTADARWRSGAVERVAPRWAHYALHSFDTEPGGPQLERLAGSAEEVTSSAQEWSAGRSRRATVLLGADATRSRVLQALARRPAVIHLATHVLLSPSLSEQGFLVLSLSAAPGGDRLQSEFLSTSDIAGLQVPGTLVVMTGCESGGGVIRAGAGVLGLTRAWLMAGADAVVSTLWAVEDTRGELFRNFYRELKTHPAAEALRLSQLEELHSGTWRAAPVYWASYQVTGGSH
jgi:CHAT domain-containing protein